MSRSVTALGLDPGLRDLGISAVERFADGSYRTRGVRVSHTEPTRDKAFSNLRSSADDQRRLRDHWSQITDAIRLIKPDVIGVENYLVFEPQDVAKLRDAAGELIGLFGGAVAAEDLPALLLHGDLASRLLARVNALREVHARNTRDAVGLGQASKTIAVYGTALGAAFTAGIPVFVFEPSDRTRLVARRKGVSKEEVGAYVEAKVHGLAEYIAVNVKQKTRREHVWDATAHALLAAEQYIQLRLDAHAVDAAGT
jgi:Holliday junction resolvasome RuvABC endonuclease subunit